MGTRSESNSTRRGFIAGAAAGAGALAAVTTATSAVGVMSAPSRGPYREKNRVDLHAHHIGPDYLSALHDAGIFLIGGIPIPEWSPELAIEFMDGHGIALQMLSVSDPGVDFLTDESQAAALARGTNDYLAQVIAQYPKRFGGFGVVSLRDPEGARVEAKRTFEELRLDGIGLLSSSQGRYLGDPVFDGLLSDLNARGAWVMVHPTAVAADDKPSYKIPDFIAEYPFDTTRTIISLLFNGVFARYRNIRWHFAHGGGTVPMLRYRMKVLAAAATEFGPALGLPSGSDGLTGESAIRALRRARYDTALVPDVPALRAVEGMTKVDGILFGSDWPFAGRTYEATGDPAPALSKAFDVDERHAIDRLNAVREFKRLRKIVPAK